MNCFKNNIVCTIYIITTTMFLVQGCSSKTATNINVCSNLVVSFSRDIQPIFISSCSKSGCHDGDPLNPGPLVNYNDVKQSINQILPSVTVGRMPKDSALSEGDKNKIICWINNGSLNN